MSEAAAAVEPIEGGITYDGPEEIEAPAEVVEAAEVEVVESPAEVVESVDDEPVVTAKVDGLEVEGPDGFKKAIDKQHKKFREQERRAIAAEERLKTLEANAPAQLDVVVPPVPDSWDNDYEQQMRQRDLAIAQKAQNDAQVSANQEARAIEQQRAQRAEYDQAKSLQDNFAENSKKLGVTEDQSLKAQNALIDYGVSPDLANALLKDSDGPLMVQHLAANPLELYDITQASPLEAGLMLGQVKAKAAGLRKKTSQAPDPAEALSGRSVQTKERGPAGARFE